MASFLATSFVPITMQRQLSKFSVGSEVELTYKESMNDPIEKMKLKQEKIGFDL